MTLRHAHRPLLAALPGCGRRGEAGTGLLGSAAGVAVFLALLLFAVQLLTNLYAASTVSAAGLDAARRVAAREVDHGSVASVEAAERQAEAGFRDLTGRLGDDAQLTWTVDGTYVRLEVRVQSPAILPAPIRRPLAFDHLERTYVVRIEEMG